MSLLKNKVNCQVSKAGVASGNFFLTTGAGGGILVLSNTWLITGQSVYERISSLEYSFFAWPSGISNTSDSSVYVNPASVVTDINLLGLAVNGVVKFVLDTKGDTFVRNLMLSRSSTGGDTMLASLTVEGNTTLGNTATNTVTVNANGSTLAGAGCPSPEVEVVPAAPSSQDSVPNGRPQASGNFGTGLTTLASGAEKICVSVGSLPVSLKTSNDNLFGGFRRRNEGYLGREPVEASFASVRRGLRGASLITLADAPVAESPATAQVPDVANLGISRAAEICPYCGGRDFVKRGTRRNKYQIVQLYLCRRPECGRTFTAQDIKGKKYPLNVVLEGLSIHNLGYNLEQTCAWLQKKFGVRPDTSTLAEWYAQYEPLCRFSRLRPYIIKMYPPAEMVETVTLAHRQLYRFRYHRGKMKLLLEEYKNRHFGPLKEYLDNVSSETPHQYFQAGERMSEIVSKFNKAEMIVRGKFNFANRLAKLVLQAVADNKLRHEALQRFFLANDSVTVASEVPVYLRCEDVAHMENQLNFKITDDGAIQIKGRKKLEPLPRLLTGHIDLVQVRNGQIHLLDYKPNASKEKPVEQLTWYALALSRLTGLRLYEFKCAWFDEQEYFEFYPLHVVKKLSSQRKRRIKFKDGTKVEIPKVNKLTIV